jgi:hypothetical protein
MFKVFSIIDNKRDKTAVNPTIVHLKNNNILHVNQHYQCYEQKEHFIKHITEGYTSKGKYYSGRRHPDGEALPDAHVKILKHKQPWLIAGATEQETKTIQEFYQNCHH